VGNNPQPGIARNPCKRPVTEEVSTTPQRGTVLVVDDNPDIGELVALVLRPEGYRCDVTENLAEARRRLAAGDVDVCLCDLNLGPESGLDLAVDLRNGDAPIPLVLMSGSDDTHIAGYALDIGAADYLLKPFRNSELLVTVANAFQRRRLEQEAAELRGVLEAMVARRTLELALSREETIHRLARAVEFREAGTGPHVERMAEFCRLIALRLGIAPDRSSLIRTASQLHDIGKLGIPDRILGKPGPLTAEERSEIQEHTTLGHRILRDSTSDVVQLAAEIALTHHERFDGGGYPRGLAGDDIPLEGRIAAVSDVFDAVTSSRPYRPEPFTQDEAIELLRSDRGTAFDPEIVDAFLDAPEEIERIRARYADADGARTAA
jgi:putative two-component system response regulator